MRRDKEGDGCFLCEKGEDSDDDAADFVVSRGDTCYALLNEFPYTAGHLMIAPYRHTASVAELTDAEWLEIRRLLADAQRVMSAVMSPDGFNIGFNQGRAAGAAVEDHLHIHLVPRWVGDTNFMPILADTHCIPEALEATCRLLRENWS